MSAEETLNRILKEQDIADGSAEMQALKDEQSKVEKAIVKELDQAKPQIEPGGSVAKGTLIKEAYDLDVACYFSHDDDGAGKTLKEIYQAVERALKKYYDVQQKRSALRLKTSRRTFQIDVVPGRFIDGKAGDVFLYQSKGDKERLQTNLRTHVSHVSNSGHVDVIRLAKLWKLRAGLVVKTCALELLVIESLKREPDRMIEKRLLTFWKKLRDKADELEVEDPANPTGNDLSEVYGDAEKEALSAAAALALELADQGKWSDIFSAVSNGKAGGAKAEPIPLGDTGHCKQPIWKERRTNSKATITCKAHRKDTGRVFSLPCGGIVTSGTDLEYSVATDVPKDYDIYWQVVNTGRHAEQEKGLRGIEFFRSRDRKADPTPSSLTTWEKTLYTGKHWIECFVVKENEIWARSGRFYVGIVNPEKRGCQWWRR